MKTIFNPDNGAAISDVTFEGVRYFADKFFEPGSVMKFEDDRTAAFFTETFQFLEEISVDKAKELMAKPPLKCEKCTYTTRNKGSLTNHAHKHEKEAELDELGIPVVRQTNHQKVNAEKVNNDVQQQIDNEGKNFRDGYPGLEEGEGLTQEKASKGAIMN